MLYKDGFLQFQEQHAKPVFHSFFGYSEEQLSEYGFTISVHEDFYQILNDTLQYTSAYKDAAPFCMEDESEELLMYYDPKKPEISIFMPRHDFCFHDSATNLFKDISDITDNIENFAVNLNDIDVKHFYIDISPTGAKTYHIEIKKDKWDSAEFADDFEATTLKKLLAQIREFLINIFQNDKKKTKSSKEVLR